MRFENLLQTLLGHPRAFIVHLQDEPRFTVEHAQVRTLAVLQGIVDQVAHAPAQRQRLAGVRG
ncbi:hypothetical protein D3C75_1040870 [compost metagenome]